MFCAVVAIRPGAFVSAAATEPAQGSEAPATKIPPEQLDALVAPIALYPDPLLAQTLAASTYPLEIVQLQQWLARNTALKDKALADAVAKQPWDPSIQAMAALPDVVKRMSDDIQWTADLGNAFLAQQSDVMDAVQRMRNKAKGAGNLESNAQQKVETQIVGDKSVIVVEQANPQVVYVPVYNPVVVYGPALYPYPPIYYPPPYGMAVSFGVGVVMGAFWSGGWGWGCGWNNSNVNININNNFNRVSHYNTGRQGGSWQHNPQHRGGTPYPDRTTANRFGGATRGDSLANRQTGARQQAGQVPSNRTSGGSMSDRAPGSGGADRIGNQDLSRSGGGSSTAFDGDARGYSGSDSRAASNRGASSMGSSRGRGGGRRR